MVCWLVVVVFNSVSAAVVISLFHALGFSREWLQWISMTDKSFWRRDSQSSDKISYYISPKSSPFQLAFMVITFCQPIAGFDFCYNAKYHKIIPPKQSQDSYCDRHLHYWHKPSDCGVRDLTRRLPLIRGQSSQSKNGSPLAYDEDCWRDRSGYVVTSRCILPPSSVESSAGEV